ncbi:MAG: hypothetical protein DBY43_02830 [Clostridiaceae bacterium]|nr:MAG: hypothetical protein DBY43_02830 [Clostridiaceae bacterium]
MEPRFLIDTNCVVTPYNDYYCPRYALSNPFWERMRQLVKSGEVGILTLVRDEIVRGAQEGDWLAEWVQSVADEVINPKQNSEIVDNYGEIMRYIANPINVFSRNAQQSWMRDGAADPWLVASTREYNAVIITFEKCVRRVPNQLAAGAKIPNIAHEYGVSCISLFDFMEKKNF